MIKLYILSDMEGSSAAVYAVDVDELDRENDPLWPLALAEMTAQTTPLVDDVTDVVARSWREVLERGTFR